MQVFVVSVKGTPQLRVIAPLLCILDEDRVPPPFCFLSSESIAAACVVIRSCMRSFVRVLNGIDSVKFRLIDSVLKVQYSLPLGPSYSSAVLSS